jgi:hypothetical protein
LRPSAAGLRPSIFLLSIKCAHCHSWPRTQPLATVRRYSSGDDHPPEKSENLGQLVELILSPCRINTKSKHQKVSTNCRAWPMVGGGGGGGGALFANRNTQGSQCLSPGLWIRTRRVLCCSRAGSEHSVLKGTQR